MPHGEPQLEQAEAVQVPLPAEPTAVAALRAWRDLLPDAPREATLTSDTMTAATPAFLPEGLHGRPVVTAGFVWIGELAEARRYLETFRRIGRPIAEEVAEMRYVDLQTIGDDRRVTWAEEKSSQPRCHPSAPA